MTDKRTHLSTDLQKNISSVHEFLPIGDSFDFVFRDLELGSTGAYWLGINGFCETDVLQQIFSDLQNPYYTNDKSIHDIVRYMNSKIGYAQATLSSSWEDILRNVLSGPSVLFIDGFAEAILIDVRTYPARSIEEPDAEKITKGARDGFVETLLTNTNLIRRRIRSTHLTFAIHNIGSESKTDVAVAYMGNIADLSLLDNITAALQQLQVTSLTMGAKSLEELLVKKR